MFLNSKIGFKKLTSAQKLKIDNKGKFWSLEILLQVITICRFTKENFNPREKKKKVKTYAYESQK